jgi:hypothetical protein
MPKKARMGDASRNGEHRFQRAEAFSNAMLILPLVLCALLPVVNADYFSDGWKPGQAAKQTTVQDVPTYTPAPAPPEGARPSLPKLGLLDTLLTSGPVGSLLGMAGINMTQKVLEAQEKQANIWDRRIPLITDDNFEDLIANVDPSSKDEVWFIIM